MTVSSPITTVHQTFETTDLLAMKALVESLGSYIQTAQDVDAAVDAAAQVQASTIAALDETLSASISQLTQSTNSNSTAIAANVTALSQQVARLSSAESSLSQQSTLNDQQETLIAQLDVLTDALSAVTNEQASDILENLFGTKVSLGGTVIDLRYLLFFDQALNVYRTTLKPTSAWAGSYEFELGWNIPIVGNALVAPGQVFYWPAGTAFDPSGNPDAWEPMPDQSTPPDSEGAFDYIRVVYQVSDAFGLPAVELEHEVILRKQSIGPVIKTWLPYSSQALTYAGGTQLLLGLLVATYGEDVKEQFFPSAPDTAPPIEAGTEPEGDENEAPNP